MTYKARRTRDLQGEVQAGTGISVSESVKPDGTKVYTLDNTAPGSEYFTTERTEGGWAILNQDNNIVLASSSEFDFNEKGVIVFTKDGEPFAIVSGTKADGNQAFTILNAAGTIDLVSLSQNGIKLRYDNVDEEGTNIYPGQITLYNSNGDTNIEITTSDIYIYNNDEGNDNLIIEHSGDCKVYIRNRYGNDGVLIETYDDQPATVKICDQDGNEILNSESLVDMVNATASITIGTNSFTYGTTKYRRLDPDTGLNYLVEPNNIRSEGDYYDYDGQAGTAGGTFDLGGIRFAYAGLYKITINWNCWTGSANDITRHIDIHRGDDIVYPDYIDERTYHPCQEMGGGDYYQEITESIMLDLQAEDILVIYWTMDGNGSLDSEHQPIFNIQKVR